MLISRKLPLAAAILTIVSIGVASTASLMIASKAVGEKSFEKLEAIADGRRNQLQSYLSGIREDLLVQATSTDITSAFKAFKAAWGVSGEDATSVLQKRYITDNPNETGKRDLLDNAGNGDAYDAIHGNFHPKLRKHLAERGYDDIYLFDLDGNAIYTVSKEPDYATNVVTGEWKDTGLARAFSAAMALDAENGAVFDNFSAYAPSNGVPASFIAAPILENGEKIGVVAFRMPVDQIDALMSNTSGLGETGETVLVNREGVFVADSAKTPDNDILTTKIEVPELRSLEPTGTVTATFDGYRDMHADAALAKVDFMGAGWSVAALMDDNEVHASVTSMRNTTLMIALGLLAASIALSTWFSRTLTRPIAALVGDMKNLAEGDTGIALNGKGRHDEIGDMVRSVVVFRDAAVEKVRLETEADANRSMSEKERAEREAAKVEDQRRTQEAVDALADGLAQLADGDLSVTLSTPFMESLDTLRVNFNTSVQKLGGAMARLSEKSGSIDLNAREVRSAADDLSKRTEQQAASIEETSAALEQITATIKETSSQASEAAELASAAKVDTDHSTTVVMDAGKAMQDIEKASGEITNIINVIDEIAFQTNLLALNAGVEAARAGEAGKGFAVVAQEVRELAQRTAVAAKEIKSLINKSGDEVKHGVDLVKKTAEALDQIAHHVSDINEKVASIATATAEQLTGVQEINVAVGQIDQVTQKNAAMVEETTAVSHGLAEDVASLSGLISEFRVAGSTAPAVRPAREGDTERAPSPARKLMTAVSSAFGSKAASNAAAAAEDWEEF